MAEGNPTRFVGLDVHKFYLIAVGACVGARAERQPVFGPPKNQLTITCQPPARRRARLSI